MLLFDKTLPKEENPNLARAIQDFYSISGCVGVGYDDSEETASSKASTSYSANKCQAGEPAKTIRFRAYNGTFYCIMTTNIKAYQIRLEEK